MANSFPTLDQIRDIVKTEGKTIIAAFDKDLKSLEGRVNSVENKVDTISTKLDDHITQNEKDFSELHNTIQDLMGGLDKSTDQKIARHCQKYHSVVT